MCNHNCVCVHMYMCTYVCVCGKIKKVYISTTGILISCSDINFMLIKCQYCFMWKNIKTLTGIFMDSI